MSESAVDHPTDHSTDNPAEEPADGISGTGPLPRRRRGGRGRKSAIALLVLLTGGAASVATLGLGGGDSGGTAASELPPKTAEVTRQTLKDVQSEDGELGYGPTTTAAGRLPGTLTRAPRAGDTITRGKALYEVDDRPVALMYGSVPAYRALRKGTEGTDVRQLEKNLRALGYTGFTVDDEYTAATADAVTEWQEELGLDETGTVELGRVVFAPGAVRVDSVAAGKSDPVTPGAKVLTYTGTAKAVTVELDPVDQRLAKKGSAVGVRLPDGSTVQGRVDEVSTVIEPGSGDTPAKTRVKVIVSLKSKKAARAAEAYALAAVHVDFTSGTRKDVLTVPVAALLALAEGGFGVEVVEGSTSRYVPVTTGLFADGRVEISGNGISAGTKVGMPK
ncbi:peptidoglycan-binding protein [Streptomyces sp. CA-135486]|uniref:peptidoglycan-binding protein n=1 Tax=Streptomyces sp. CA-135486 TaxID=3240049 RepID=UPI003D93D0C0